MIRAKSVSRSAQRLAIRGGLSLGLAGLAFAGAHGWAESRAPTPATEGVAMTDVLVTAHPIEAGQQLAPEDFRWQRWPVAAVAPGWLVRAGGMAAMVGRVSPVALASGVPLSTDVAVAPGAGSRFAAAIRPGWRAISIAVTPAAGLAGFVTPGDRVDLLLTQSLGARRTAKMLIGDIIVLGVDQRQRGDGGTTAPIAAASDAIATATAGAAADPPNLVTLEVTPRQAEAIAVAAELGKLSLVLRGPGVEPAGPGMRRWDSDVTGLPAAMLNTDTGGRAGAAAVAMPIAAAAPTPGGIEIAYGVTAPAAPAVAK
jgi:pilus assembly protein CpaB